MLPLRMACSGKERDVMGDLYRRHVVVCLHGADRASVAGGEVAGTELRFVSLVTTLRKFFLFFRYSRGECRVRRRTSSGSCLLSGRVPTPSSWPFLITRVLSIGNFANDIIDRAEIQTGVWTSLRKAWRLIAPSRCFSTKSGVKLSCWRGYVLAVPPGGARR